MKSSFFKKMAVALIVGLALLVALPMATMAAGPIVSVDAVSPGGGDVTVTTTGIDSSAWHAGQVGQVNTFRAQGGYTFGYDAYAGNYGSLQTYVNASTATGGAFTMTDTQDFHILSANNPVTTENTFTAVASGTTASMNLKSIGSMVVWSEATNPYWNPGLSGQYIYKSLSMTTSDVLTAFLSVSASTTGTASISNSNIWGFGADKNGNIFTNYGGGTRTLIATGTGTYDQFVSAGSNATSIVTMNVDGTPVIVNGSFPAGGTMDIITNFVANFTASPYTITAK